MYLLTNTAKTARQASAGYTHSDGSNVTGVAIASALDMSHPQVSSDSFPLEQRDVESMPYIEKSTINSDGYLNDSTYLGEGGTVSEYFECIDILENNDTSVSPIIDGRDSYSGATKDNILSFEAGTAKCFSSVNDNVGGQQNCVNKQNERKMEGSYLCFFCKNIFYSQCDRNEHIITQHARKKCEKNNCPECDMSFLSKSALNMHLSDVHNNMRYWYKCSECDHRFSCASNLKRHKGIKHENKDLRKTCPVCKNVLANEYSLKIHMKSHSKTQELKYYCSKCRLWFLSNSLLKVHNETKKHKMNVNKSEINYECEEGFDINSLLKQTKHECVFCEKFFISKRGLIVHFKTKKHQKMISENASNSA